MAQFDVHRNMDRASRKRIPFLLDVQTDLLASLATRVVVPLAKPEVLGGKAATRLNPVLKIDRTTVVMLTPELAGVPAKILGPRVASLQAHRSELIAALDLVFTGF